MDTTRNEMAADDARERARIQELHSRFKHHPPTEASIVVHEEIRGRFIELADMLDSELPPGRETSLVMTKLEEAMFWANAAIARAVARQ